MSAEIAHRAVTSKGVTEPTEDIFEASVQAKRIEGQILEGRIVAIEAEELVRGGNALDLHAEVSACLQDDRTDGR
jgi:hypothetical protein